MPVASRVLDLVTQQPNGSVRARAVVTDLLGRIISVRGLSAADPSAAQSALDAMDLTESLKALDEQEIFDWVRAKNDPSAFDFTDRDLTLLEAEERLLTFFAASQGSDAIPFSWWIESLGPPAYTAIRTRVGFDSATGSEIQDRAIDLSACEARFDFTVEAP